MMLAPIQYRDFIALSPPETAFAILAHFTCRDLCRCQCVSRAWQERASDPKLWKELWQRRTGRLSPREQDWKTKLVALERFGTSKPRSKELHSRRKCECIGSWERFLVVKSRYFGFHFLKMPQLKEEIFLRCPVEVLEMVFYLDKMFTVDVTGGVHEWDLSRMTRTHMLQVKVFNFCIQGHYLFSQYRSWVQKWDLRGFHIQDVFDLPLLWHKRLSFGSAGEKWLAFYDDSLIAVFDHSRQFLFTLIGHRSHIYKMEIIGDYLISCAGDETVRIWNLVTQKCVRILRVDEEVWTFALYEDRLYAYTMARTLYQWEFNHPRVSHHAKWNGETGPHHHS